MEPFSIERAAFNKAGYILINHLIHNGIDEEYVNEDDKYYDLAILENDYLSQYRNKVFNNDIIMCIRAGSIAERYYCWIECINYDPPISGDDLWMISRLYYEGKHKIRNFEEHIRGIDEETEVLIKKHWSFVMIVAGQLIIRNRLTTEEIKGFWNNYQLTKKR